MAEACHNPLVLPDNLPVPQDDGARAISPVCGCRTLALAATDGSQVDLSGCQAAPWSMSIRAPGSRGCRRLTGGTRSRARAAARRNPAASATTSPICRGSGWRTSSGSRLRTAPTSARRRSGCTCRFAILSDAELELTRALRLPTFSVDGMTLIKRMAWVIDDGVITQVFYPVFPPDQSAETVMAWLERSSPSLQRSR